MAEIEILQASKRTMMMTFMNFMQNSLISAINEPIPSWDHRLPMSDRYEPIKQMLWNEIYVTLNG